LGSLTFEFERPPIYSTFPRDGRVTGGLIWFPNGEKVRAEHAITKSGRVFDRGTRYDSRNAANSRNKKRPEVK
jgi:hypothetical protein